MRKWLLVSLVLLLTIGMVGFAYPTKAVTIICPWGAGGGTDRLARFLAEELNKELGQPFVVVNRTGGGGAVGHGAGAYARADGYTITLVTLEIATMHWLGLTPLTYENFEYIAQVNEDAAGVIVNANAPWQTLTELLDDIRDGTKQFLFSGSGAGTIWDLSRIGMLDAAGIDPDEIIWVPTTGAAPSIVELLGNHVDVITCSLPEAAPQIQSGQLRALAVMADQRNPGFSGVPTLKEYGINWSSGTWRGIAVPVNTPKHVKEVLEAALIKISDSDSFKNFMNMNGFGIRVRDGEAFQEFNTVQNNVWREVLVLGGYIQD